MKKMNKKNDCSCPGELSPSAKFALAQLDPFEPKCLGAKVPDTNTMPSIANADTDQVTLAGPATNGNLIAIAFNPSYVSSILAATEGAASVSWGTTFSSRRNYTNVIASVEAIRPVAHAVRMVSPLAPTSTTGFVHVGIAVESRINSSTGAVPDYPTTVNQMTGLAHYKRFTLASLTQSPVTIINKWIDETAFRYEDPRSTYAFAGSGASHDPSTLKFQSSWGTLIVMVEGQPSSATTPISFEHLLLTECLPRKDAWILGSQAAPNSPGTMSAVSVMTSETDFAHTEAQQDSYINEGLRAFERGASVADEEPVVERRMAPSAQPGSNLRNRMYKPDGMQAMGDRIRVQTELRRAIARRNQRESVRSRVTPLLLVEDMGIGAELIDDGL